MYPKIFREKVLAVREKEDLSIKEVAERFCVGEASVMRWLKRIEPKMKRNKPATKIDMEALKEDVERYPDGYQTERAERLGVSKTGIAYALKRLGISYKKNTKSSQGQRRREAYLPRKNQNLPRAKPGNRLH